MSFVLLTGTTATPAAAIDRAGAYEIRDRLEYLINRTRARHGLRRLRVHSHMQSKARGHALNMAYRRRIYHDPNLRYEVGSGAEAWGENVARTTASDAARRAHDMFMSSSAHRAILLKPRYTHMAIGVAKAGNYTYVVERFADHW